MISAFCIDSVFSEGIYLVNSESDIVDGADLAATLSAFEVENAAGSEDTNQKSVT